MIIEKVIETILEEVDSDISEVMKEKSNDVPNWAHLVDPAGTIIAWQRMRDDKKVFITHEVRD